jgi:hypothetical protein
VTSRHRQLSPWTAQACTSLARLNWLCKEKRKSRSTFVRTALCTKKVMGLGWEKAGWWNQQCCISEGGIQKLKHARQDR